MYFEQPRILFSVVFNLEFICEFAHLRKMKNILRSAFDF
jgi:hypothetical protein